VSGRFVSPSTSQYPALGQEQAHTLARAMHHAPEVFGIDPEAKTHLIFRQVLEIEQGEYVAITWRR
jgi:hypothetical protein